MMKYGQGAGRGQWAAWAQGGPRRFGRRRRSGEAKGFRPPIGRAVGRWPEGEGECSDRTQPSLTTVRARARNASTVYASRGVGALTAARQAARHSVRTIGEEAIVPEAQEALGGAHGSGQGGGKAAVILRRTPKNGPPARPPRRSTRYRRLGHRRLADPELPHPRLLTHVDQLMARAGAEGLEVERGHGIGR
jgi:hypothetical protein